MMLRSLTRRRLLLALVAWPALLCLLLLAACDEGEAADADVIEAGESVYLTSCARCHQEHGEGWEDLYPALASNPIVTLDNPNPLVRIVLNGTGGMPGFRDSLEPEEVAQVVTFIRQAWGNDASAVTRTAIR